MQKQIMQENKNKRVTIDQCLDSLIKLTQQALDVTLSDKIEELDKLEEILASRQEQVDRLAALQLDPKTMTASQMAQRARLLELNTNMLAAAQAVKEKQRQGLVSVKQERVIARYGQVRPDTIQALDIRE